MAKSQALMPLGNIKSAQQLVERYQGEIEKAVRGVLSYELLASSVLNSARKNPGLLKCTSVSWCSAILQCASTGLIPDTPAQECHLVPFKNEVVWIAGYRGLAKLARQSGEVIQVEARAVFEKDKFEYGLGLEPYLKHQPCLDEDDPGDMTFAYAIARFADAPPQFEVMSATQIFKIRDTTNGKYSPAWKDHPAEQGRKTVFRRLFKWLPQSPEGARAVELDNKAAVGEGQPLHEEVPADWKEEPDTRSATEKLADEVAASTEPEGKEGPVTIKDVIQFRDDNSGRLPPDLLTQFSDEELVNYGDAGLSDAMKELQDALSKDNSQEVKGTKKSQSKKVSQ